MPLPALLTDLVEEATGGRQRPDQSIAPSGGPAGNARLTAWTGLLLLTLILGELVTLLDVSGLISWHVVLGTLLVPVALLKTASTSWRVGRYYTGHRAYRTAGPPPMLLRLLGPLVVVTTLGLLGSGLALIALGPRSSRQPIVTIIGRQIDPITLHKGLFILFGVTVGLHLLARLVPAVTLVLGRRGHSADGGVPGRNRRTGVLLGTLVAAAVTAAWVLGAAGGWQHQEPGGRHGQPPASTGTRNP